MSSPTTRASNTWEVNGGDDLLQLTKPGAGILGGIDFTGAGFGALAGGSTPGGAIGDLQFNGGPGIGLTNANGVISGATAILGSEGNLAISSPGFFQFTAEDFIAINAGADVNIASAAGSVSIDGNQSVTVTSDIGGVILSASAGFIQFTSLSYGFDLGGLLVFATNADAITGGLSAGNLYRTGADPDVVCVVH